MLFSNDAFSGEGEYSGTFLHHFLIECAAKHGETNPGFIERIAEKEQTDVTLTIDGEEVDISETLQFFWSQMDNMIKERACKLMRDKFVDISDNLQIIENEVLHKMKDELGFDY
jgi:hypothetical protein